MSFKFGDIVTSSDKIDNPICIFVHELEPSNFGMLQREDPTTFCVVVALDNSYTMNVTKRSLKLAIAREQLSGILNIINRRTEPCQPLT